MAILTSSNKLLRYFVPKLFWKQQYAVDNSFLLFSLFWGSVTQSCMALFNPMDCSRPGFPVHHQLWTLLKLMSIEWVIPSNHLLLCHPLLLLPSIFPSIRVFSSKSVLRIRWPKYWSFSFSISLSSEYSDSFPLGLTGWISLQSKGLSRVFSNTTVQKFYRLWMYNSIVKINHLIENGQRIWK